MLGRMDLSRRLNAEQSMNEARRQELAAYQNAKLMTEQNKVQNKERDSEIKNEVEKIRIQQLQYEAHQDALKAPEYLKLQQAEHTVKHGVMSSLRTVKEDIKMGKLPRGRIVRFFLCDLCGKTIQKPASNDETFDGFIIQGNVYLADPDIDLGLIGNNIPQDKDKMVNVDHIKRTVLCKTCLLRALGVDKSTMLKREVFVNKSKNDVPF